MVETRRALLFARSPAEDEWSQRIATMVIHATHGDDDPERAILAFTLGNVAVSTDQRTVVLLTIEGVWLATKGYAERIHKEGFEPLKEIVAAFVANGGEIWVSGGCARPRGISEADLIDGARIVTAAQAVGLLAAGAVSLSF